MSGSSGKRWTLISLMAVVVVLIIATALLLPVIQRRRAIRRTPYYQNMNSMRVINQGLFTFADSNNGYFPGLDNRGHIVDVTVENRFWLLLDNNTFTSDHIINRYETEVDWNPGPIKAVWTTGPVTSENYSYAMLKIDGQPGQKSTTGRGQEWRSSQEVNPEAVLLSDRNIGTNTRHGVMSPSSATSKGWDGAVAWGDGSATIERSYRLTTRYGANGQVNYEDNLFEAAGTDDAYMIYTGTDDSIPMY